MLENKFEIGEIVYLTIDEEQKKRVVTGFTVRNTGIAYGLTCGVTETWHFDFEITKERNVLVE